MRPPKHLFVNERNMEACTDLYEMTMAAGYFLSGANYPASFEIFVRELPAQRAFLVAAGLEQALAYLRDMRFGEETIQALRSLPPFHGIPTAFFEYLRGFRFTGDVHAVPEGTVVFAQEPLVRITAPLIEAQVVETYLLATITFQTTVASKAARIVQAAGGKGVVDFGGRRAHGPQASVLAAGACFVGGFVGTSNVFAGREVGIPPHGTTAHSYIMAFPSEQEAFESYLRAFPNHAVLLPDTYDTVEGARKAVRLGPALRAVRIDSGDLDRLSRQVRRTLDDAGLNKVRIIASGDLDERRISRLVRQGAPIDVFGVGTAMVTSRDEPALGGVYKIVAKRPGRRWEGVVKHSEGKESYPRRKHIFRTLGADGRFRRDTIGLAEERGLGEPLLKCVMRRGKLTAPVPRLADVRRRALAQISRLPQGLLSLDAGMAYRVHFSTRQERARKSLGKCLGGCRTS
jgi:nicotinate phosphoribosyltransferase